MKKLVVLTGAGMSAESGVPTFRGADGLWEGHRIEDVASPLGFQKNPSLVLDFYNQRRRHLEKVEPNAGHIALKFLEEHFQTTIITQNVDNLHERAGSTNIIHLHGSLTQARSSNNENEIYDIDYQDINIGDLAEDGTQLRPNIVWFGESVPLIEKAAYLTSIADIIIIIGTSLLVYPAAGLVDYAKTDAQIFYIDPNGTENAFNINNPNLTVINQNATVGIKELFKILNIS
jgi:NAD-dependent deacetylase